MQGNLWIITWASSCIVTGSLWAQQSTRDIPYLPTGHKRHVLDIYTPEKIPETRLPVVFWIHGGGWVVGDKSDVSLKPKVLTERGYLFISTNYRLLPEVSMEDLMGDVAKSVAWVTRNIHQYGGDPNRLIVGGHSAGAQIAALLCTDERYLKAEGVPFDILKGCTPVDGDTYDIPKIILTAEHRQALYGGKMFTYGHRQKFGNDPEKHVAFSAVTHVASGKGIPPFLLLFFSGNPDTTAQAHRMASCLTDAGIPAKALGKGDTNHSQLNNELGMPDDPASLAWMTFLDRCFAQPNP